MPLLDRDRKANSYPWLEWKVRLFAIGAALALAGMAMDLGWLVGIAILVLALAFLLRFLPGGRGVEGES